jgi:hypothetical protein
MIDWLAVMFPSIVAALAPPTVPEAGSPNSALSRDWK